MGCATSTKQTKQSKYSDNNINMSQSSKQQKPSIIKQQFVQQAKEYGINVDKIVQNVYNDPSTSDLPTKECRSKVRSNPAFLQNIEILHKHRFPKLKPLSTNNLYKNRQSFVVNKMDHIQSITSFQHHKCSAYFSETTFNDNRQSSLNENSNYSQS